MREGDGEALNELVSVLHEDLRRLAARHLRSERREHTLQATALVNEVYLKLCGDAQAQFTGRSHFFAVASRVMRQVLVDYARARATKKRSGEAPPSLEAGPETLDLLELNRALDALALEEESLVRLIEMRYFGGMTAEESAEALQVSVHKVRHDLRLAQAWLRRHLHAQTQ